MVWPTPPGDGDGSRGGEIERSGPPLVPPRTDDDNDDDVDDDIDGSFANAAFVNPNSLLCGGSGRPGGESGLGLALPLLLSMR
jgi:hypothetical protein